MVSIIIVQYHVKKELFACINSVIKSEPHTSYEIIVVDNDEQKRIGPELLKQFPTVRYLKAPGNVGFGAGNNIGANAARGDYLFFLNPDTLVSRHTLDKLLLFLNKHKKAGVVAPLLLSMKGKPYQQGTLMLNPLRAVICLSFINKFFPNNPISRNYWLSDWNFKTTKQVDVVPGTAFMLKKKLYHAIGGFDERFFLYFEEFDLCKRIASEGYELFITPEAQISHIWGASTKSRNDINLIFRQSRFYYFKKHFGVVKALFVESILRCDKFLVLLGGILAISAILSLYRLLELMPLIGDQAWYYLSARDMVLTGNIPFVGIPSSHPWLHQGAFWTYLLAGMLTLLSFNPLGGAYLTIGLHMITVFLMYFIGARMFSRRVGIIASLLYGTSPLILFLARMPYHTSPIPVFSLLFLFSLYQWLRGNLSYFPIIITTLAVLYNFEIATFLFTIAFLCIWICGYVTQKHWARNVLQRKWLTFAFAGYFLPMLPMLFYDFHHGFPQTLQFLAWIGYKVLVIFGYPPLRSDGATVSLVETIVFIAQSYQKLLFIPNAVIAAVIALGTFVYFIRELILQTISRKYTISFFVLSMTFLISLFGLVVVKTPSDAYLPLFFPLVIYLTALFFASLLRQGFVSTIASLSLITGVTIGNIYSIITHDYYVRPASRMSEKFLISKQIVSESGGKRYMIQGTGGGSEYESFTMPYEYLTWWLGYPPSQSSEKIQFIISEEDGEIQMRHLDKKN